MIFTPHSEWVDITINGKTRRISNQEQIAAPLLCGLEKTLREGTPLVHTFDYNEYPIKLIIDEDSVYLLCEEKTPTIERVEGATALTVAKALQESLSADWYTWLLFEGYTPDSSMSDCERTALYNASSELAGATAKLETAIILHNRKASGIIPEDKAGFTNALNNALIRFGANRYDYLVDNPLTYVKPSPGREAVEQGSRRIGVTADSLTAMMKDIAKLFD